MAKLDLSALIAVEYKSWIDTSDAVAGAQLARHFAALSNHGGGYLIFGVDDSTKLPQGASSLESQAVRRGRHLGHREALSRPEISVPRHISAVLPAWNHSGPV